MKPITLLATAALTFAAASASAGDIYENAYFGDLHVHTSYSLDSYIGFNRVGPDEAYRFAKGEPIEAVAGTLRLTRPLDFAAVTDHVEFMPEIYISLDPDHPKYDHEVAVKLRNEGRDQSVAMWVFTRLVIGRNRPENRAILDAYCSKEDAPGVLREAWGKLTEITERHNEPGVFTALHGFEWTSAPNRANLHRNVIFGGSQVPELPVTARYDPDPESLWRALEGYRAEGMDVLAIPHNSNASRGLMFTPQRFDGSAIDRDWAERRASLEPVVEIMQGKGNSEVYPGLANADEYDDFELSETIESTRGGRLGYVREGLKEGLRVGSELGVNPFKFGLIASTDTHSGNPGDTEETTFNGGHAVLDATPQARLNDAIPGWLPVRQTNPGGLAGVWARENTRDEIYGALARREVFGTSGTRMRLRFFGGWGFSAQPETGEDVVLLGYGEGVAMGGDLPTAAESAAPVFLFWALKDPESAALERVQIVKGWYDGGELHERIYNVALSDGRVPGEDGSAPELDTPVNLETGEHDSEHGATELMAVWRDPDFSPDDAAFYYARALELPTARWSTLDAIRNGLPRPEDVPATVRERAWSSPIWYTPSGE